MKSDPHITYRRKSASLDISSLEAFAETLCRRVARGRGFHCRITNDTELKSLNARYRRKNYATDVLSFHTGDIAISLDRARVQARERGHSTEDEIRILMLHGVLHFVGFDHESDAGEMKRAETRWRRVFRLPMALIERAA